MAETVLVLPVILLLLLMLLFYGISMARLQRASGQDRYEAWRRVHYGFGPRAHGLSTITNVPYEGIDHINTTFWKNGAEDIGYAYSRFFPDDTRDAMIDEAGRASLDAGDYTDQLLNHALPHGSTFGFDTTFVHRSDLLDTDTISHGHTRIGSEWKYVDGVRQRHDGEWVQTQPYGRDDTEWWRIGHVTPGDTIRYVFMEDLDQPLESPADSGNRIAIAVRGYYRWFPGYRGPDVDYYFANRNR